jgi:hypothetical protein
VKAQPATERETAAATEADTPNEAKRAAHAEAGHARFIIPRHARARPATGQHADLFSTVADMRTSAH